MKKLFRLLGCMLVLLSSIATLDAVRHIPPGAKKRIEKIKAAKLRKKAPKKPVTKLTRVKRHLGYVRHMPNKLITLTTNPSEGYLVNQQGQRVPVVITDRKGGPGFYLGAFYDLDSWTLRYAYLK